MADRSKLKAAVFVLISGGFYLFLATSVGRADTIELILSFFALFAAYAWVLQDSEFSNNLRTLLIAAVVFRLIGFVSLPALSDDYARFIWDGTLLVNGLNPFVNLPGYYLEPGNEVPGLTPELFDRLNSREYFTIYPPLNQGVFFLAAWFFPTSIFGAVTTMRAVLLAFEMANIWLIGQLLPRYQLPARLVLLYALNPLVVVETTGNLHFEGMMLFFVLLTIYYLFRTRFTQSAIAYALGIGTKLIPLIFGPLLLQELGWKKSLRYFLIAGLILLSLYAALINPEFIRGMSSSVSLYFQRFEFNASIYFIIKEIGYYEYGYNIVKWVGPCLALAVLLGIVALTVVRKRLNLSLASTLLLALLIYYSLATTVHPWYLITMVGICIFTPFRFPVVWSLLILLTYIGYRTYPFELPVWVLWLEYLLVYGYFLAEWNGKLPRILVPNYLDGTKSPHHLR